MKIPSLRKQLSVIIILVLVTTLLFICSCTSNIAPSDKIGVVVTILPQAEFVKSIGREKVDVTIMIPPGTSPHTYEPSPKQMQELTNAKIYSKVGSGIEFELVWMNKLIAANKEMSIVDCSRGIQLIEVTDGNSQGHQNDEHEKEHHKHSQMDPHIWMSPLNAKMMVQNICDGLIQVDPANKAYYEDNKDLYLQKLIELDFNIKQKLSDVTNRKFMVYHPSFGYFARDYDLTMIPIEIEGKEPTAAGLIHLIAQAKEYNIKVIFASPQFNPESAKVIADTIEGYIIFIDPLDKNYIQNINKLTDELAQVME